MSASRPLVLLALLASAAALADKPHRHAPAADDTESLPEVLPATGCITVGQQRAAVAASAYRTRFSGSAGGQKVEKEVHGLAFTDGARAGEFLERPLGDQ